MNFNIHDFQWTREPASFTVSDEKVEIVTKPHTDLWQRTYYHFRNDNAPVFQMETEEKFFSFVVKTSFEESHHRFDQCGIVMYLDSDNWLKGSIEYENEQFQHLGSVATNNGYSDWATTAIDASVKSMWYRFSRREDDYCIECSTDGENFSQMRQTQSPPSPPMPRSHCSSLFLLCCSTKIYLFNLSISSLFQSKLRDRDEGRGGIETKPFPG